MNRAKRVPRVFVILLSCPLWLLSACTLEAFRDFNVISASVEENGIIGTDRTAIVVTFSKTVDPLSVDEAIRIETDDATEVAVLRRTEGRAVTITPDENWEAHQRFWLIVKGNLKDSFGKELGIDYFLSFQSTGDIAPVSTLLTYPEIEGGIVTREISHFDITFSGPVHRNSVERAFSISPDARGYFEWFSDISFRYHLTDDLSKNTLYVVSIPAEARDENNNPIEPFSRVFEYFPNIPYPIVREILVDDFIVYQAENPDTYTLEGDRYVVVCQNAEKDSVLRINFSKPMKQSTFHNGLQISPFSPWRENWMDDEIVTIVFEEDLYIQQWYDVSIARSIKDADLLNLQYRYELKLNTGGENSRFVILQGDTPDSMDIDVQLYNGSEPIQHESVITGMGNCGYYVSVMYDSPIIPADLKGDLTFNLRFSYNDASPYPVIDPSSLQDSFFISSVFGSSPGVDRFDWTVGGESACTVTASNFADRGIYRLYLRGGREGVHDDRGNYLAEDVEVLFELRFQRIGG
jgi:hypothetical protein